MWKADDFAVCKGDLHSIGSGDFVAVNFPHQHDEFDQLWVSDTVINPIGLASGNQDLAFLHESEVLGNIALGRAGFIHQGLHLQFFEVQRAQDFQPGGMGHCLEDFRGTLDIIIHGSKYFLRSGER